jgi:hypothetical protein
MRKLDWMDESDLLAVFNIDGQIVVTKGGEL